MVKKNKKENSEKKVISRKTSQMNSAREVLLSTSENFVNTEPFANSKTKRFALIMLFIFLAGFFLYINRQRFVVAFVNGQPITRWQLNDQLTDRYGSRTLDAMISEKLVADEIKKQKVEVDEQELKARMDQLEKSLPQGMNFDDALKAQGLTNQQFKNQLRLQLAVDKLLGQEVSMSAVEVENYMKENKASLPATDPASLQKQVEETLRRQKTEELFQGWFASLKEKASIQRYL